MTAATAPDAQETVDVFHRGAFALVQPRRGGHRAGMDAMMLAAAVPGSFAGRLVDLGAGAGGAGLAVAARCGGAEVVLVERSPEMADFAARSLSLPDNAALAARVSLVACDVTLAGRARAAAGLDDGSFDFAIMNPPFNDASHRPSPDRLRREAHVMETGELEAWVRTAAAIVRPGGGLAAILRPEALGSLLPALAGRFGALRIKPIHPRADAAAIRIVVTARRGARAPLSLLAPLVLHETGSDRFSAIADAINNGRASLFGD